MEKLEKTYIDVLLPLAMRQYLTYGVPFGFEGDLQVGQRVLVSVGKNRYYAAIVVKIHQNRPLGYVVKDFIQQLDEKPILNLLQLRLWEWMASYYMSTQGEVMSAALPSGFKIESETQIEIHPDFSGDISNLTPKEIKLISLLEEQKRISIKEIEKKLSLPSVAVTVKNLMEKNAIAVYEEVREKYRSRKESYVRLSPVLEASEAALSEKLSELEKSPKNYKQIDTLLIFITISRQQKSLFVSKKQLLEQEKTSESSLNSLVKKGILLLQEFEVSRLEETNQEKTADSIVYTDAQKAALEEIWKQWEKQQVVLLHGVTGSGKTEIYINLIDKILKEGKQVLYLLPEIALTTQIIVRLRRYFGKKVGVYHSRFNELERVEIWNRVQESDENGFKIIIGARSALFLPFHNLGLIIVDEEHDTSYKQYDPAPRYHARDVSIVLSKLHDAKVLLGSATPSVESLYNAQTGKYAYVALKERYAGMELPKLTLVDLKQEPRKSQGQGWIPYSKTLLEEIRQALNRHEQVILFQNRRGFSLHLECDMCHYIPMCKHCDVALTYHKDKNQLRCHYCGYTETIPNICPQCGSPKLQMHGFGTEKVEEELSLFFPSARIARLDYDSTRNKTAYQRIIYDFECQKIDILVGTQMVTKGLDFDHVSTVGILNADNMLYFPDFRAYERAYQILSQVSGRAGRKFKQGKVLIQTFQPNHPIFQWVVKQDEKTMLQHLLLERKQFLYPPYCRFIKLSVKHNNTNKVDRAAALLANILRQNKAYTVLGPAYPSIPRIKNLYMKDIMLKIENVGILSSVKTYLQQTIDAVKSNSGLKNIQIAVDVDPY